MSAFEARRLMRAGNSVAVCLPPEMMARLGVVLGDVVAVAWSDRGVLIQRLEAHAPAVVAAGGHRGERR